MDPKVLNFLYLNGFVILVVVLYIARQTKKQPSRLKLRQSKDRDKLENPHSDLAQKPQQSAAPKERQLTVNFQFNGHNFEAYEVFGLAAGSSLETVEKAYKKTIETSSSDSHEFFRIAYNAIKRK